jgi:hypothetical protein
MVRGEDLSRIKEIRNSYNILIGNPEGKKKKHLEDVAVAGNMMLQRVLKEQRRG